MKDMSAVCSNDDRIFTELVFALMECGCSSLDI
jgi:hypothetical protein